MQANKNGKTHLTKKEITAVLNKLVEADGLTIDIVDEGTTFTINKFKLFKGDVVICTFNLTAYFMHENDEGNFGSGEGKLLKNTPFAALCKALWNFEIDINDSKDTLLDTVRQIMADQIT